MSASDSSETRRRWFEPASAILMAFATLGTVWCSYQSSKWSGESSEFATEASSGHQQAALLHLESNQITSLQAKMFAEYLDAHMSGDDKLAQFYLARFAPELRKAYDSWMAQNPFENPKADPHPFVPSLYQPRFVEEVRQMNVKAGQDDAEAKRTGHVATQYLSITVLLAAVLFFAGTSAKFDQRHVRLSCLFFAITVFLFAAARICTLPVTRLFS